MHVPLREYQTVAVGAITQGYRDGLRRVAIEVPTGGGKTIIFARVIEEVVTAGGRVLVLAHTEELVDQAAQTIRFALPGVHVGIVQAQKNEVEAQIIVGTVQSIRSPRRLDAIGDVRLIVIDECHHSVARTYVSILDRLGALVDDGRRHPFVLGCSATLDRGDKVGLSTVFEKVVYATDILTLIERGYLVNVRAKRIMIAGLDLDRVKTTGTGGGQDFTDMDLGQAMEDANAPADIAQAIAEHAADRKSVVFVPTVALAHQTAAAVNATGLRAAAVSGATPKEERRAIIAAVRSGELQVIANAMVLTEGFDAPVLDCVVAARPTKSRALYQQQVGRGLRPSPGKEDCLVLDMAGNTARHELQHLGGLFGLPPDAMAEEETVTETLARTEREAAAREHRAARLIAIDVNLFERSNLNWIRSPHGAIVLTGMANVFALRTRDDDETCDLFRMEPAGYGYRAVLLDAGISVELAQGIAEGQARQAGYDPFLSKRSGWRIEPATDPQRKQLWHLRPDGWSRVMTKGDASNLIAGAKADNALAAYVPPAPRVSLVDRVRSAKTPEEAA